MLSNIREKLKANKLDALLINSTNEYLVEYNALEENARYILTGFSGSTGDAIITEDKVYLFVDGRYHIQADSEVNHEITTVIKLQNGDTFLKKILELLPAGKVLGIVSSKNSQSRVEKLEEYYKIVPLETDYIQTKAPSNKTNETVKISTNECGLSEKEKIKQIRDKIQDNEAVLISNSEEVSYLYNIRNFSTNYSSKVLARAIITKDSDELFYPEDTEKYRHTLLKLNKKIYVDKTSINARDYEIIKDKAAFWECNPIQQMKAIKTEEEIISYKKAFQCTDKALKSIRKYIYENNNISEYDIDKELECAFKQYGAKNLSFKSIIAKDENSALAHYSKSSKQEIIEDGSLILIDCGAYYDGGLATDITRVFVKGTPTELQIRVYTTVLKAFLHAFNTIITPNINGYDIDNSARKLLNENQIDGFIFNHGLGHGIGISVHEYPPNLSCNELAKVPLRENMCFTIEPGLYNKEHFGVRLENSCYLQNNKIHSFTNMNYEKKLINIEMLTEQEKEWLKEFEVL